MVVLGETWIPGQARNDGNRQNDGFTFQDIRLTLQIIIPIYSDRHTRCYIPSFPMLHTVIPDVTYRHSQCYIPSCSMLHTVMLDVTYCHSRENGNPWPCLVKHGFRVKPGMTEIGRNDVNREE
jgi:hypothetical protein